ncbi:hypothetical protein RRF57_002246 [Xylaria bambusicola]|uniref:Uncharacterized protein n=1 Tax=Xylaria bambusicola TaxID=326684 RepID=A0AAN7UK03_9PEZI
MTRITPLPLLTSDFTRKIVIVTRANDGIGRAAAQHFLHPNAQKALLGCRDLKKGSSAKEYIESVWQVNLASFDSLKAFSIRVGELDRLDVVIENSGLLAFKHEQFDGYECQTTVNVISPFLDGIACLAMFEEDQGERHGV